MSKNTDAFDRLCGHCAGIALADITVDDVLEQCSFYGASEEATLQAIAGLIEYQARAILDGEVGE